MVHSVKQFLPIWTIYRFYEIVQVDGTTLKALIHEEFGDGTWSAIDSISIRRASRTRMATV